MEFMAEFDEFEECPPFLLTVWDYDEGSADDYLGSCVLRIDESMTGKDKPCEPKWHYLKYGNYSNLVKHNQSIYRNIGQGLR